jgi:hypothetical protein
VVASRVDVRRGLTVSAFGQTTWFEDNWRVERRADGLYVMIEEIGGLGALGPFTDLDAARRGLAAYLSGTLPEPASPQPPLPSGKPDR